MRYIKETDTVLVTDAELAEFAYRKVNLPEASISGGFSRLSISVNSADTEELEPFCKYSAVMSGINLTVSASPCRVYRDSGILNVEISSRVKSIYSRFNISYNPALAARGIVCAKAASDTYGDELVRVVLTTVSRDTGESISFYRDYTVIALDKMSEALISRASVLISVCRERNRNRFDEINKLTFPYKGIRDGQQELMLGVMKTVRRGGKLLASAPTGTGKTMATLYPAVKALGKGYIDRIFYLTGKTVTGKIAIDSMKLLAENAPSLRCIMINSKDRICAERDHNDSCFTCPRMNDSELFGDVVSYKERRDRALSELLEDFKIYDRRMIGEYAEKYSLCPYELSLDVSEYCDMIICDYNYVFDSRVRFQRYFIHDRNEKYALLVDECHNLPDRVRASYSAVVSSTDLAEVKKICEQEYIADVELNRALRMFDDSLENIKDECLKNSNIVTDRNGEHSVGFVRYDSAPAELVRTGLTLGKLLSDRSKGNERHGSVFKSFAEPLLSLGSSALVSGEGFEYLAELLDNSIKASLICIDPSTIITEMTSNIYAVVMFSATLNPTDYFADMLGLSKAPVLKAESPFDKNNLSVTVFDGISTKLNDRKNTSREIAETIATVIESKEGHYFVFFPSYSYMKMVSRELLTLYPDICAVMQKKTMSISDREKFISAFKSKKFKSIVGLCVLGGVFSEGVDLAGDELIGVIVVGAGLPGVSSELNLISEYFEGKYGRGRLYAYEYPAINRIEQAAGRVIRTATDRGVVVLIDDRLSSREMISMFPDFWPQIVCTSDINTLSVILERFWSSFEK